MNCCDPHEMMKTHHHGGGKHAKVIIVKGVPGYHGHHGHHGHMSGCCDSHEMSDCCHPPMKRHFITKAEMLEHLELYKDHLSKELQGVEEAIAKHSKE